MVKEYKTIGMVVAMDKEVKPFLEKYAKNAKELTVNGFKVFECDFSLKKVYLIKSGIGEIYAAAATQVLISVFNADIILNFGVCGSLTENISVCETAVISGVVHYDFDLSKIDNVKVGQYPNEEVILKTDEQLLNFVLSFNDNLKTAVCASGDKFIEGDEIKEKLSNEFLCDVCDMESAGVLLTSKNANVPCFIIKAVSDGKGGAEEFNRRVFEASKVYLDILKLIIERI